MKTSGKPAFLFGIILLLLATATTSAAPPLVAVCKGCHDIDGSGVGKPNVPIIAGIPAEHIAEALYAYKDGARQCRIVPAMCAAAARLGDDEIAELAAYYGSLPRQSHAATFSEELAREGEEIHARLCSRCHLPPDDPDVAHVLGYPLHGQRADYLRYALESYLNGTREHLLDEMKEKIDQLEGEDVVALVHYYTSY